MPFPHPHIGPDPFLLKRPPQRKIKVPRNLETNLERKRELGTHIPHTISIQLAGVTCRFDEGNWENETGDRVEQKKEKEMMRLRVLNKKMSEEQKIWSTKSDILIEQSTTNQIKIQHLEAELKQARILLSRLPPQLLLSKPTGTT